MAKYDQSEARRKASEFVMEAAIQVVGDFSAGEGEQFSYIVADMAVLARSIEVMADHPVIIGMDGGTPRTGFDQRRVNEVRRLAMWIAEIGERAAEEFDAYVLTRGAPQ